MDPMRSLFAVLVLVTGLAGALAIVALAAPQASSLPAYTDGYAGWKRLNAKPFSTPGAHSGVKNVYASKPRVGKLYPNGTVIVKSIADPGAKGLPRHVAVMRKVRGTWQWVEYEVIGSSSYGVLAKGSLCVSCHMQARANDWVFTRR